MFEDRRIVREIVKHERDLEKKHDIEIEDLKQKRKMENEQAKVKGSALFILKIQINPFIRFRKSKNKIKNN